MQHQPKVTPLKMAPVVESNVPMPEMRHRNAAGPITAALRELARAGIGDSVFVPGKTPSTIGPYIINAAGKGWAARKEETGGVRVWKRAEPKAA